MSVRFRDEQLIPSNVIGFNIASKPLSQRYESCGSVASNLKKLDPYNEMLATTIGSNLVSCSLRYSNPNYFINQWEEEEEKKLRILEEERAMKAAKRKAEKQAKNPAAKEKQKHKVQQPVLSPKSVVNETWRKKDSTLSDSFNNKLNIGENSLNNLSMIIYNNNPTL